TNVFEDIFQHFSRLSAPGTDPFADDSERGSNDLAERLDEFYLRDAASAELPDKVSAAWTCYTMAAPRGVLLDQHDGPGAFIALPTAVWNLLRFAAKAVGLFVLAGLLLKVLNAAVPTEWAEPLTAVGTFVAWARQNVALVLGVAGGLLLLSLAWLGFIAYRNPRKNDMPNYGMSAPLLAAWAYLEAWCALWLAAYLLVTYFLGWAFHTSLLFDERLAIP